MPFPKTLSIETPLLQELVAAGGSENVRDLYERLAAYFPQITANESLLIKRGQEKHWKSAVQKTGKTLEFNNLIRRSNGVWTVTDAGRLVVEAETSGLTVSETEIVPLSHVAVQTMLAEIGVSLGFYAQTEFEYYDVIWKENEKNNRISHVFEVQSKGNIDSAFAKLKRAYEAQRTKPFLIISTEKDSNRARRSLAREFQDIEREVSVFTFAQIQTVHQNLNPIAEIIKEFLLK